MHDRVHVNGSPRPEPRVAIAARPFRRATPESLSDASTHRTNRAKTIKDGWDSSLDLFTENSTFHGVRDLAYSSATLRALWAIILSISIFFTIHGCVMIVVEYYERPVVVSYYIENAGHKMTLPDVIICPFNRFNRTFLESLNITGDLAQYLEITFPSSMAFSFQRSMWNRVTSNLVKHDENISEILARMGNMSFTAFMRQAAIDCTAFFPDSDVCQSARDFMTSAGRCFRITGGEQVSDGYGYGQRIMVTIPKHLYNSGVNQMLNDGIFVKLAHPEQGVDDDLTFISAGVHAIMPLKATQYQFINDPPRYPCSETNAKNYSRLWCFENCLTSEAEEKCNCSLIPAANPGKATICTARQFLECFFPAIFPPHVPPNEVYWRCQSQCKSPCTYWSFSKSVSSAALSPERARVFTTPEEAESLHNMIILDVFYTSLEYTVIKHMVAMTPSSLIAQLGGQMSLWIGGSIISIFQAAMYLGGAVWTTVASLLRLKRGAEKRVRAEATDPRSAGKGGASE